ncbi:MULTISPECIES: hypothetical protein [Bacillaceae]|uniref:Uncharacterized protein n=1 Tax=Alkalicoccobacillus plakortidis TaxID=444060 RepID=A0A9D5I216_9BACI|nr:MULTISPECIES: hypothetical protein [Bacillaceae]KQL57245.1 hypothetical protein AN965_09865 [Alkalicoccobacillus plakortidis]
MNFNITEFKIELKMEDQKPILSISDYTLKSLTKLHRDLISDQNEVKNFFIKDQVSLEACIAHIKAKLEDYSPSSPAIFPFIAIFIGLFAIAFGFIDISNLTEEGVNNVFNGLINSAISISILYLLIIIYDFVKTLIRKKLNYILSMLESFRA